jgi:hypothetical protein
MFNLVKQLKKFKKECIKFNFSECNKCSQSLNNCLKDKNQCHKGR